MQNVMIKNNGEEQRGTQHYCVERHTKFKFPVHCHVEKAFREFSAAARRFPVPRWPLRLDPYGQNVESRWQATAAKRTSGSPDEQWRTLGGSGYAVAKQLAGFHSERMHKQQCRSSFGLTAGPLGRACSI